MFLVRAIFVKDIWEKCLPVSHVIRGGGGSSAVLFVENWKNQNYICQGHLREMFAGVARN